MSVVVPVPTTSAPAGGMIPFAPTDAMALYQSYMPFLKNGGLYVTGNKKFDLGHEVLLLVKLPGHEERTPAIGKVVLVNRSNSVARPSGVGVQLADTPENTVLREKIDVIVAGINPDTATLTM